MQLFTDLYRIELGLTARCLCQTHRENMNVMKIIIISQGPPTSCCITMKQHRAPQNYN